MKTFTTTLIMLTLWMSVGALAQSKVKEKDLDGVWMLKIEIDEEDWKREIENEENALARAVIRGVSGLVDGILDEIDIRFEFMKDNKVRVYAQVFGQEEVDYAEWNINDRGELEIGDTEHWQGTGDTIWLMEDGILVAYDKDGRYKKTDDARVYLVRID